MKREPRNSIYLIVKMIFTVILTMTIIILLFIFHNFKSYQEKRERLLCETNYKQLLESLRDILDRVERKEIESGTYSFKVKDKSVKDAFNYNFPKIIKDLKPVFILITDEEYILLEIGGIPYEGFVAYPENTPKAYFGDVELIPGLWYYYEDYRDEFPKLKKDIDKLIQRGKINQTH